MIRSKMLGLFAFLVVLGLLTGCSGSSSYDEPAAAKEEPPAAVEEAVAPLEVTEEILLALARADAVDGTEDKVVAKCPGCALAMEGSADHAMHVDEYELHFCSDDCKGNFEKTASDSILALAMPEL